MFAAEGGHLPDAVVYALPRGGVPVGAEVAKALHAPLEVFVSRKIGAPFQPEFGIGAIAEGGVRVLNGRAVSLVNVSSEELDRMTAREETELQRRVKLYRGERPLRQPKGRMAILVDDGLATGVTAEAALVSLRKLEPKRLVLAVPVCAPETAARLESIADDVVSVLAPADLFAVGVWYDDFRQTSDAEVIELLAGADSAAAGAE